MTSTLGAPILHVHRDPDGASDAYARLLGAQPLDAVLLGIVDPARATQPAAMARPENGAHWYVDAAAAGSLRTGPTS